MAKKVGKCEVEIKAVVPDPFELAKSIRRGEKDDELPGYEVLTGWLQRVPVTWLPGLLADVVQLCTLKKVFQDGKLVGGLLEKDIRLAELELEVRNLKQQIESLMCLVDPQDVRAAASLKAKSPSNAQLRLWSQSPRIPAGLAEQQEERPW